MNDLDFESVMSTALHTAYPLIFTDIPFANEIYKELCKSGFPDELRSEKLAFELEARNKLIDKFLKENNATQILDVASGYTSKGLNWCLNNPNLTYVEFDLPKVINYKKELLSNITTIPENLHFMSGNALEFSDLEKCLKYFDTTKPIAVINQGLMRYLDFDEKEIYTKNVYNIISKNNGVWITCDITPAKFVINEDNNVSLNYNKNLTKVTARNNTSWRFRDKKHVEDFLFKIGFKIEWHDFCESIPMLSSLKTFKISKTEVEKYLENAMVGVITVI